jgi:hypothetical protein
VGKMINGLNPSLKEFNHPLINRHFMQRFQRLVQLAVIYPLNRGGQGCVRSQSSQPVCVCVCTLKRKSIPPVIPLTLCKIYACISLNKGKRWGWRAGWIGIKGREVRFEQGFAS